MEKKLIITKDGSPSFEVGALKETYHSRHGARTESEFVYIQQGLAHWHRQQQQCRVFELGLAPAVMPYLPMNMHKSIS